MKALLIVFVLVAAAVGALYYFTDLSSFDASGQYQEVRGQLQPGMSWTAVVELKEPKKMAAVLVDPEAMSDRGQEFSFDRAAVEQAVSDGKYADGFLFMYSFGEAGAFDVYFDQTGTVTAINDVMTFNDLAAGKAFKQ